MKKSEASKSRMLLVTIPEGLYPDNISGVLKKVAKSYKKICYVCFSRTYNDAVEYIWSLGLDTKKFYFIDVLTSHYKKPKTARNCTFIDSPTKLETITNAIQKAVTKYKCDGVFIDTISSLLIYHEGFLVLRFTNELKKAGTGKLENLKYSVLVAVTGDEMLAEFYNRLSADLIMYADEKIILDKKPK